VKLTHLLVYTLLVHAAFACARVDLSLFALHLKASPMTVGVIMSLLAVIPMLVSVHAGRYIDRVGPRVPMLAGTCLVLAGIVLCAAFPALETLFVASPVMGLGFLFFHIGVHQAVGLLGGETDHTRNFGLLGVAFSISSFVGPMLGGFSIDLVGHRATFAVAMAIAVVAVFLMARNKDEVRSQKPPGPERKRHLKDLLRAPGLRPVLIVSGLLSMSWDLFAFAVPIYGVQIGLSASRIGVILGAFGLSIFFVRLLVPVIGPHVTEWQVLIGSMLLTGISFAAFPFVTDPTLLTAIAFFSGAGLGAAQPMIMALIYRRSPPGRAGETVGVRSLLLNISQTAMPLITGAFGAALGMAPGFVLMAVLLGAGCWHVRRQR